MLHVGKIITIVPFYMPQKNECTPEYVPTSFPAENVFIILSDWYL